jgi:hypothetical protein
MVPLPSLTTPAIVKMKAWTQNNVGLDQSLPVYFSIMNTNLNMPLVQMHRGSTLTSFTGIIDPLSYIGIQYPDGYSVSYKAKLDPTGNCVLPTWETPWIEYDKVGGDGNNNTPLQFGNLTQHLPALTNGSCVVVYWKLDSSTNAQYPGYGLDDLPNQSLKFSVAPQGNLPVTKSIEHGQSGGGRFHLDVSETFGGFPVIYFGHNDTWNTNASDKEQLNLTGLAPTDMGAQFSVLASKNVRGLFSYNDYIHFGFPSNMLAGHNTSGKYMWGFENPLVQTGQTLKTVTGVWIPMYSDDLKTDGARGSFGGSTPLWRQRPVRAYDARFDDLGLRTFSASGQHIERLTWDYRMRIHRNFEMWNDGHSGYVQFLPKYNLFIKRNLLTNHDTVVYIVWDDKKITGHKINNMSCKDWRDFTRNPAATCSMVDKSDCQSGICDQLSSVQFTNHNHHRIIYDFRNKGLAISEQAKDGSSFKYLVLSNFAKYPGGTPFFLHADSVNGVDLTLKTMTISYKKGDEIHEARDFFLAPRAQLDAAGVGLDYPFSIEAENIPVAARGNPASAWTTQASGRDSGGQSLMSVTRGSSLTTTVIGNAINIVVSKSSNAGRILVTVDGKSYPSFDLFSPVYQYQQVIHIPDTFPLGSHTVTITVDSVKNINSKDYSAVIDRIDGVVN